MTKENKDPGLYQHSVPIQSFQNRQTFEQFFEPLYTWNNEDFVLALEKNILEITLGKNLAHTRPASAIWGRAKPSASGEGAGNLCYDKPPLVDPKPCHLFQEANPCHEPFY